MGAKPDTGGDVHAHLIEDVAGESDRVISRWNRRPYVKGRAWRLDRPPQALERLRHQPVAPRIDLARGERFRFAAVERLDGGPLHRLEDARVDVGLELADESDQVGAPAHPADAPARHVVGLRERVELETDLLCALDLEQAQWPVAVERDLRIRRVVAEHDAVTAAEFDRALEELTRGHGSCRIVRIVEPHQPRALGD